jgi:hypothetical protein
LDAGEVFVHHGDVSVDEGFDEGWAELVGGDIDAGFVADFAVGVVEFKVADGHAVVGAGEEFGDRPSHLSPYRSPNCSINSNRTTRAAISVKHLALANPQVA